MKLEEYLEKLKNCPDSELASECGVHDNWPILLQADLDKVIKKLIDSHKYVESDIVSERAFLNYVPGVVELQFILGEYSFLNLALKYEIDKQGPKYDSTITLHPFQKKKIKGVSDYRAVAIVIDDLAKFAMKEKIPICFPRSLGWDHKNEFSRLVSYNPKTD
jgi:hypothetical protein